MYEFTSARSEQDLAEIADLIGKTFSRKTYWFLHDMRTGIHAQDTEFKPEHSFIAKYEGHVVAHVGILVKHVRIGKSSFKVAGIGEVATHRDHMKKGISSKLMKNAVEYMQKTDFDYTILSGIPNYYHRFGYIETLNEYEGRIPVKFLRDISSSYQVVPYEEKYKEAMIDIYTVHFENVAASTIRSNDYYIREHFDKEAVVVLNEKNTPVGYGVFWDTYLPHFCIKEASVLNYEAAKALLAYSFKRCAEAYTEHLVIYMPPSVPFMQYAKDFHLEMKTTTLKEGEGGKMGRIIHLDSLFSKLSDTLMDRIQNSIFAAQDFSIALCTDIGDIALSYQDGILSSSDVDRAQIKVQLDQRYLMRFILGFWTAEHCSTRLDTPLDSDTCKLMNILFPLMDSNFSRVDYF